MHEAKGVVRVKLVAIVASAELQDRLIEDLQKLGMAGFTLSTTSGRGHHGTRMRGLFEMGNVRIETLVPADVASAMLQCIVEDYHGQSVIAFTHDVDAAPADRFVHASRHPR
jgi:nitrogen regulatory protein PII